MATIQASVTDASSNGSVKVVKWVLNASGDVGAPYKLDRWNMSTVQVFGSAVTAVAINGSNDADAPANFAPLSDWQGNSLGALSVAGLRTPRDMPLWIQPVLTNGSAVTVQNALHRQDMGASG